MTEILTLRAGALALDLAPACGGAITRFDTEEGGRRLHWFRPSSAETVASCDPMGVASFPLVPYSNRIRDGRFPVAGRTVQVPLNLPPERHALHGEGWQHPWTVTAASDRRAELAFEWSGPLTYAARQRFELSEDGLVQTVEVTNRGEGPMPAGLGVHPWFPLTPGARMTANLPQVWLVDDEYMPVERVAAPRHLDFSRGLAFAGSNVANCFSGWDGRAVVEWPEHGMRLTIEAAPPLTHLVLYAPEGRDFFCVEPVSNAVDAFNLGPRGVPDVGYAVLRPGETLSGTVRFGVGRIG